MLQVSGWNKKQLWHPAPASPNIFQVLQGRSQQHFTALVGIHPAPGSHLTAAETNSLTDYETTGFRVENKTPHTHVLQSTDNQTERDKKQSQTCRCDLWLFCVSYAHSCTNNFGNCVCLRSYGSCFSDFGSFWIVSQSVSEFWLFYVSI